MSRMSAGAAMAWKISAAEAAQGKHPAIEPAHLFVGLLSLDKVAERKANGDARSVGLEAKVIRKVLDRVQLDAVKARRRLRSFLGTGDTPNDGRPISRSGECKSAFRRARKAGDGQVTSVGLLIALLEHPDASIRSALERSNVLPKRLREELLKVDLAALENEETSGASTLERFGRDLTRLAARGELGPVIGRRPELLRLLQTLARESKNNPVLVGEAGVGKTAIVEALAIRAAAGKDPAVLADKRIVEINVGNLLAGAKYRGQFEERLTDILSAAKNDPNLVIFIDEIHTVMGAGRSGDQGLDAANMLKPALARGELRCIGATTPTEYRRHIESDPALERRFEKVLVPEPTREETIEILEGLRPTWEEHHEVRILDESLEAAVDLSLRFDTEHRLPDKAIDLVDKAAARTRVPVLSMMAPDGRSGDEAAGTATYGDVTEEAVAYVLAEKRGVPPERVLDGLESKAASRLLELDGFLGKRLIGQDEAVLRVGQRIRLAHSGIKTRRGPLAVFLFLGPTGVGKTEMARLLAEFLFGSGSDLVRFDMSEYMQEHSVSKLIGAPPGYVGHDEEGQLTFHLTRKPYSVVLFDEIEKAHARVFDLFLQLFDEGRLTDSKGRLADARHAVFVMTSNLGASKKSPGFGGGEDAAACPDVRVEEAQHFFRPELWNRIDEVVSFRPLEEHHAIRILRPWVRAIGERLIEQHGVRLSVTPEAEAFLAREGYSATLGARELQRTVERLLQVPLSNLILSGKIKRHPEWQLVYQEGGVHLLPRTL